MCIFVLHLNVVPLGKTPFAVQLNNNKYSNFFLYLVDYGNQNHLIEIDYSVTNKSCDLLYLDRRFRYK
jgi:hypothetical protein